MAGNTSNTVLLPHLSKKNRAVGFTIKNNHKPAEIRIFFEFFLCGLICLLAMIQPYVAMLGGIDKFVLYKTKEEIRTELEYKMQPMMQKAGGIVFGLDHRIPNGVSLDNYRYYVDLGLEILGLPPLNDSQKGWGRMAF